MNAAAQTTMRFPARGGARPGAGRPKRKGGVSHATRPKLTGREALHVTIPVLGHVWNLRTRRCFAVISAAFVASAGRFGMRVVALGVQGNHLHLLVEAANALALTLGMQGLAIRLAKGLNRLMGKHGRVFRERYHCRVLRTPAQVRNVLAYIRGNTAKHARQAGRRLPSGHVDRYTVGWFGDRALLPEGTEDMVSKPETWLLTEGWKRTAAPTAGRSRRDGRRAVRVPHRPLLLLPGLGNGNRPATNGADPPPGELHGDRRSTRERTHPAAA